MVEPLNEKGLEAARKAVGTIPGAWLWSAVEKAIRAYLSALPAPDGELRRYRVNNEGGLFHGLEIAHDGEWVSFAEAASTILSLKERLERAISPAYLETAIAAVGLVDAEWKARAEAAEAQVRVLEQELDQWSAWAEGLTPAEISNGMAKREARIKALEEALEPFAAYAWSLRGWPEAKVEIGWYGEAENGELTSVDITVGHFFAARAALSDGGRNG